jgi:hypothetical protein
MAKALIGYMNSDLRDPRLASDNARLRARVAELESLVLRLSEENDKLVAPSALQTLRRRPVCVRACALPVHDLNDVSIHQQSRDTPKSDAVPAATD